MWQHGWLDSSEFLKASAAPLGVLDAPPNRPGDGEAAHFVEYVKGEALTIRALGDSRRERIHALLTGGYTIETTLNPELLYAAMKAARLVLGAPKDPSAAIAAVEPGDGAIRLLFGGLQPWSFDAASRGSRNAGSAVYPFVFLAARQEIGAGDRLLYDALVHGRTSGLTDLAREVGPTSIERVLRRFGIGYRSCATDHIGVPRGVAPLDVAAAYAALSADGRYARPYAIARITDRHGRVVYRHHAETHQVVGATDAQLVTEVLRRATAHSYAPEITTGQVFGSALPMFSSPTDAWLVGSVSGMPTAVWVGHPERARPILRVSEGSVAQESHLPAWIFGVFARSLVEESNNWLRPFVHREVAPWLLSSWALRPAPQDRHEGRPPVNFAFSAARSSVTHPASLRTQVVSALNRSTAKHRGAAVMVEGLGMVVDLNGRRPLPPGSTQKLFTGATALLHLGPDWRMRTQVRRTGTLLPGGILEGDLVLVASGDPTLVAADLRQLAAAVAASGIRRVTGSLYIDDTRYDRSRTGKGWRKGYVPAHSGPLSALVVNRNQWRCDPAYVARPAVFNGQRFRAALTTVGVTIEGETRVGPAPDPGLPVAVHDSPPLAELVRYMLKKSDSLAAELLLKELGTTRARPTAQGGLEVVRRLARKFGIPLGKTVDGSGLSPLGRQTPHQEVRWLMNMEKTAVGTLFRSSLPVACREGTLLSRLCGTPAAGRLFAKTGTRLGTVALAGYTKTASGRRVWFAFMLSAARSIAQARKAADRAAVALAAFEG
jgi:D-alanyl-D-alanine carboxypeptidase/D-alanyl-D-alanine-endopeptidase (penicillin-binding protein 4)